MKNELLKIKNNISKSKSRIAISKNKIINQIEQINLKNIKLKTNE